MRFVLGRCAAGLLQMVLLSMAVFALFQAAPGDIHSAEALDPQRTAEALDRARAVEGLNDPPVTRYVRWASRTARGDFGDSLAFGMPVAKLIAPRIGNTLAIALPALMLAWLTAIPAAVIGLRWRLPALTEPAAAAAAMVPDLIAVGLLLWLAVWLGLPVGGPWLPVAGLTLSLFPVIFLHASSTLRQTIALDYIRIASSRGVGGVKLWRTFVLPAAANPLITLAGLSLASTIGGSFVVEVLTGWPGLGPLFLEAVEGRDHPLVASVLLMLAGLLVVSNIAVDLALYRVDPRLRLPGERA